MYITLSFDCEEDETRILKLLLISKAFILEKIYCKLIIYMLQWILGFFGYRMAKSCDSGFAVV